MLEVLEQAMDGKPPHPKSCDVSVYLSSNMTEFLKSVAG